MKAARLYNGGHMASRAMIDGYYYLMKVTGPGELRRGVVMTRARKSRARVLLRLRGRSAVS